ncbi:hypothetical protein [Sporosarcina sp. P20a]|nr:hypothetical protein [Sporosarcina sp. P20a]
MSIAAGVVFEEKMEFPDAVTDEEVEEEFKEWVWNQLDANWYEVD